MERASLAVSEFLFRRLDQQVPVSIFAGSGNNGGDALAIARILLLKNYHMQVFLVSPDNKLSPDCEVNKERLEHLLPIHLIKEEKDIPSLPAGSIIIDGLFGSGLNRPATGIYGQIIKVINEAGCKIYSIDMPSGLFMEDNSENLPESIVKADEVFTFQYPKLSLLLPDSDPYGKKMTVVDIGLCEKCIDQHESDYSFIERNDIVDRIKPRSTFSHKGDFGKALIISGSFGKMGAAVLSAKACLRSGVGLLTMHIPRCGTQIMQTAVPEAMVDADIAIEQVTQLNSDASGHTIGIGPGIGKSKDTLNLLANTFDEYKKPMVIDADALNLIAENDFLKDSIPPGSILTPHPTEFERLAGQKYSNGYQRLQSARDFAAKYKVYIVLKGAYTSIVTPERKVFFNSTGNPGMATGGSGDTLTGIVTSLLAQKYSPKDAAIVGVYLHGLAGDLAAKSKSQRSMLPSDLIKYIGKAYKALEK